MPALRITTGSLRGRRIVVPDGGVRPTSERARQAFFNIVGPRIEGAAFLDLFAGSGAFSFEAVSRGAAGATAVDLSRRNAAAIERLATEWAVPVRAVAGDAFAALRRAAPADIAYADPPWDFERYDELLMALDAAPVSGLVAIEHRRNTDPFTVSPVRLAFSRRAEYGEVWISMFTPPAAAGP